MIDDDTKLSKLSKVELIVKIKLLENRKKYGLVWEDKSEDVVERCKKELPVLEEVTEKAIQTDANQPTNILIEGDNYHALSVLNYTHAGKIDVIYIDPPYNTGNLDFKYNDKFVDKEDAFKHSKWLSFMEKRLKLARNLLNHTGLIFISIDDNEESQLKLLCDEVFGSENLLLPLYIQVRYEGKTLVEDAGLQKIIERVLVYGKSQDAFLNKTQIEYSFDKFNWEIKEKTPTSEITIGGKKVEIFEKGAYEIVKKEPSAGGLKEIWASGKILDGNSSGRFFRDYLQGRYKDDGYNVLYKVYGIGNDQYNFRYFTGPKKEGATKGKYYQGVPNEVINNDTTSFKTSPIINFINFADSFGNCRLEGGIEFRNGKKPIEFIKHLLRMAIKSDDSIVLDFFAGSGTTGHAVLDLNKTDTGSRQFILCTNNESDIAEEICYPRIKNVIEGYSKVEGIPSNLKYFKTTFVSKSDVSDDTKFELVKKATEMICVKENTFDEVENTENYKFFENKAKLTGILFDLSKMGEFKKKISKIGKPCSIYVFTLTNDTYDSDFSNLKVKYSLCPIPESILEVYRKLFKS